MEHGVLVARYFFDINDGRNARDEEGVDCADIHEAIRHAKSALPEIAAEEVPKDGERQAITVLVTDENGRPVYLATLTFTGTLLAR